MRFLQKTQLILSVLIIFAAYVGDYIVFKSKYSSSVYFRAISDSLVHGTLGFLSCLAFFSHETSLSSESRIFNVIFCTVLSCFIDIDHVFVARSFDLKNLTSLKERGIFHCTTFWLLITLIITTYGYLNKKLNMHLISFMVILAFSSHHLRDGNRRGLWLYPFGNTPAIDKHFYVLLLAVLPHLFAYIYLMLKDSFTKNNVVDYKFIEQV